MRSFEVILRLINACYLIKLGNILLMQFIEKKQSDF